MKASKVKPKPVQVVVTTSVQNLGRLFAVKRRKGEGQSDWEDRERVAKALQTILKSGLNVKVTPPNAEMKRQIVQARFRAQGIQLHSDVADFLAEQFGLSDLIGAAKSLVNWFEAESRNVIADVAEVVRVMDLTDLQAICEIVEESLQSRLVGQQEFFSSLRSGKRLDGKGSRSRNREAKKDLQLVRHARQLIMLLGSELLGLNLVSEVFAHLRLDYTEDWVWAEWSEVHDSLRKDPNKFFGAWKLLLRQIPGGQWFCGRWSAEAADQKGKQLSLFDPPVPNRSSVRLVQDNTVQVSSTETKDEDENQEGKDTG